jgi:hypothetical protein
LLRTIVGFFDLTNNEPDAIAANIDDLLDEDAAFPSHDRRPAQTRSDSGAKQRAPQSHRQS